jgi:hypothetical protein
MGTLLGAYRFFFGFCSRCGARTAARTVPQLDGNFVLQMKLRRCGKVDGAAKSGGVDRFDWQLFDDVYDGQHIRDRTAG